MGNKLSTPTEVAPTTPSSSFGSLKDATRPRITPTTPQSTRTTPRGIDVLEAASSPNRSPTTGSAPPTPLSATLRNRKIDRSAFTYFACGRNVFIYFGGMALLERELIKDIPGTKIFEEAAEQLWIEVAMHDPRQRTFWEDAAQEAKNALTGMTVTAQTLLETHGLPNRRREYQAMAADAVRELVARHAAGMWPRKNVTSRASHEIIRAALTGTIEAEASERSVAASIERELVSAINLKDVQSQHYIGVEPSIRSRRSSTSASPTPPPATPPPPLPDATAQDSSQPATLRRVEVRDAAATARRYLDLYEPSSTSKRHSMQSITPSLYSSADTEAEIVTSERVTPSKARFVNFGKRR